MFNVYVLSARQKIVIIIYFFFASSQDMPSEERSTIFEVYKLVLTKNIYTTIYGKRGTRNFFLMKN